MWILSLITGFFAKFKIELIFLTIIATLVLSIFLMNRHIGALNVEKALVEQQAAATNAALEATVAEQKATRDRVEVLLKSLEAARLAARTRGDAIQGADHKSLVTKSPQALEDKINADFAAQMKRLESLSRE